MEYALGAVNTNEPQGSWDLRSPLNETSWEIISSSKDFVSIGYSAMYGHEYDESEFFYSCDVELRRSSKGWSLTDIACAM